MAKQGRIDSQTPVSTNPNVPHPNPDQPGATPGFAKPEALPDGTGTTEPTQNIPGFAHQGLP